MSALTLFSVSDDACERLKPQPFPLERDLQRLVEKHLEALLGVRFLASEYATVGGRIDTLGLDENGYPVVLEYKRGQNDQVVMQGLFYIDWLARNKAAFTLLVQEKLGMEVASSLDFSDLRLICIAESYSLYDLHGVQQIPRHIHLLRYHRYPGGLLLLEQVGGVENGGRKKGLSAGPSPSPSGTISSSSGATLSPGVALTSLDSLTHSEVGIQTTYAALEDFLFSLGPDVVRKPTQTYVAFRKVKNFACVQVLKGSLAPYLKLDPASVTLEVGFSRDVTNIGHIASGNLELTLRTMEDLEKAKPLLQRAYDEGL